MKKCNKKVLELLDEVELSVDDYNTLTETIYNKSPMKHNPVSMVRFIPLDKIQPNDYNPNAVARQEMKLLYTSIKHDGYTQPTVAIYDEEIDKYIIVDGFHRYYVMKTYPDIFKLDDGRLPIVVIDKDINDRMASTVRHNRARGKHSMTGMGSIVMKMIENGATDDEICNMLGLEADELVRLKYTTGIAKLYEDGEFSLVGKPDYQITREYDPTDPNSKPVTDDEKLNENYKNVVLSWEER